MKVNKDIGGEKSDQDVWLGITFPIMSFQVYLSNSIAWFDWFTQLLDELKKLIISQYYVWLFTYSNSISFVLCFEEEKTCSWFAYFIMIASNVLVNVTSCRFTWARCHTAQECSKANSTRNKKMAIYFCSTCVHRPNAKYHPNLNIEYRERHTEYICMFAPKWLWSWWRICSAFARFDNICIL